MTVEDPKVIDFVAHDPNGEVLLVIVEGREWDGTNERLSQLQEKINSYAAFACEGQLLEQYPELAGKPVRIELRCVNAPEPKTAEFLGVVHTKLREKGLGFVVKEIRRPSG